MQTLIVLGIVGVAAFYLGLKIYRSVKGEGTGACEKCGVAPKEGHRH